jgi:hypothetical protein
MYAETYTTNLTAKVSAYFNVEKRVLPDNAKKHVLQFSDS